MSAQFPRVTRLTLALLGILAASASSMAFAGETCNTSAGSPPPNSTASGTDALACGSYSQASGKNSLAILGQTLSDDEVAIGTRANTNDVNPFFSGSTAVGTYASARDASAAFGYEAYAYGYSAAFGWQSKATGAHSVAFGFSSVVEKDGSIAMGSNATVRGKDSIGIGLFSTVYKDSSVALGSQTTTHGSDNIAIGYNSYIDYDRGVSIGADSRAQGMETTALGTSASANGYNSVAIGAKTIAYRDNTVSIGNTGAERQLVNLADGTEATDAVNLRQLQAAVVTANAYTDTAVATGSTTANAYTDNREAAIRSDMAAGDTTTLDASKSYTDSKSASTLSAANTYTDSRIATMSNGFDQLHVEMNSRFQQQDRRIDRMGAMGSAMMSMSSSMSGVRTQNRVGVGAGFQNGRKALSVGYQRAISDRANITFGGAFSGSDRSVGIGAGFGW